MTPSRATHRYEIEAHSARGGAGEAESKAARIPFDASSGQSETIPGPADLLTAAFAACILKNVERFSHILPFHYDNARIHVTSERQDSPPRMIKIRYILAIATAEDAHRVELLHRNIKMHGTIYNTLAAVCDVDGEIRIEAPQTAEITA